MAQALIFLATGFEEVEMLTVVDLLRRGGITIDMVSITDSLTVTGSHQITITADKLYEEADFDNAEILILPGGIPGTPNLASFTPLTDKIKEFHEQGKWLAAVCAAPTVLHSAGILNDVRATCYPDHVANIPQADYVKQPVVIDNNIITSRGLGTSIEFAAAIIEQLKSKQEADIILQKIIYNDTYQ